MHWRSKTLWITSIVSSLLLLALVLSQFDLAVARTLLANADLKLITIGIALLIAEGFITAARFNVLASRPTTYAQCLQTAAGYVLMLIALPARLGEVAGVALMVKYMRQTPGGAVASLLLQRIFDVIVLMGTLAVLCLQHFSGSELWSALAIVSGVMIVLVCLVVFLSNALAVAARPFLKRRKNKWARRLLRIILQARQAVRHHMDQAKTIKLTLYTLLKWSLTLTAISCVVVAVAPALSLATSLGVGIAYNLAAVIPIQTIGGAGISEVVLLGSFKWLGYSVGVGATLAIAIRLALLTGPIIFGAVIFCGLTMIQPNVAKQAAQ